MNEQQQKILLEIINIVRENKDLPPVTELRGEQNLMADLGFDSLDLAELAVRCEKEFGIDIFEDSIVTKVEEVMEKINV
ncbi:MAG TPA: acyl carrier protein [Actinobacteria bacterium]|nr:acyl carrier protein [Actinomycetota bacterium]